MNLTLEQKIGQMLCFGWSGETEEENLTYSAHARELIEDMQVGGVILMGRNAQPPYIQTAETINRMQNTSRLPLFVVTDQEGGMVARFGEPMTVFPSNMAIGATQSVDFARQAAQATAEELKAVGINFDFAPAVDVNNNPDNPIIGTRSFGESPELVGKLGAAAVEGYQSSGVIACAKHFPGHGDTAVDSHLALPVVPFEKERLWEIELAPFMEAIKAGVDSIMTTHIMFSVFDQERPATLSRKIVTDLLRGEMGFNGVVVTDCLEMKAIADNYGIGEAAVLAVEAGVDILLACHTLSAQREIRNAVINAVKTGRVPESRIDESLERILALKQKYQLDERRFADTQEVLQRLGTPEHKELQRKIAESSITVVKDRDQLLPVVVCGKCSILVTGLHRSVEQLAEAISEYHTSIKAIQADQDNIDEAVKAAYRSAAAIVVTCPKEPWTQPINEAAQVELVKRIYATGTPTVVIAVREPYDLRHFPEIGTYVATYGYMKVQLETAAKLLFGKIKPHGQLPVTIP